MAVRSPAIFYLPNRYQLLKKHLLRYVIQNWLIFYPLSVSSRNLLLLLKLRSHENPSINSASSKPRHKFTHHSQSQFDGHVLRTEGIAVCLLQPHITHSPLSPSTNKIPYFHSIPSTACKKCLTKPNADAGSNHTLYLQIYTEIQSFFTRSHLQFWAVI